MKQQSGQNLSENTLVLGLVALVAIGGLSLIGGQLSTSFSGLLSTRISAPPSPIASQPQTSAPLAQSPATVVATPPVVSKPAAALAAANIKFPSVRGSYDLKLTLKDGTEFSVPNYPSDLSSAIEVDGGNGTTRKLAATIMALADQLEESGELKPEQADLLRNLSNSGFGVAEMQGSLSGEVKQQLDPKTGQLKPGSYFNQSTDLYRWLDNAGVSLDSSEQFKLNGLSSMLSEPSASITLKMRNSARAGDSTIISMYDRARMGGALENPAVKAVVDDAMMKIARSAISMDSLVTALQRYQSPSTVSTSDPNYVNKTMASLTKITETGSGTICKTGGNNLQGLHCR